MAIAMDIHHDWKNTVNPCIIVLVLYLRYVWYIPMIFWWRIQHIPLVVRNRSLRGPSGLRAGAARLRNGCESRGSSTLKGVGLSFAGPSSPFSCNSSKPQKTCPGTGLHPQNSDISLTPRTSYHGKWVHLKMGIPILLQLKLGKWWKTMKFRVPIFRLWISTRSSTDCEESF
jgi:hypothetical protein